MTTVTVTAHHYGTTFQRTFWFRFRARRFAKTFRAVPEHYYVTLSDQS